MSDKQMKHGESIDDEIVDGFEISGDVEDIIKKAIRTQLAMCGGGRFEMDTVVDFACEEISEWTPNEEQQEVINRDHRRKAVRRIAGNLKRNGKTVLRNIRTGKPIDDNMRENSALQVGPNMFIRIRYAGHDDYFASYKHWTAEEKCREITRNETDKDFRAVLKMDEGELRRRLG